jgi:hypothetical protein
VGNDQVVRNQRQILLQFQSRMSAPAPEGAMMMPIGGGDDRQTVQNSPIGMVVPAQRLETSIGLGDDRRSTVMLVQNLGMS